MAWSSVKSSPETAISDYSKSTSIWNISYDLDLDKLRGGTYITVTLDTNSPYEKNGEKYKGDFENTDNVKSGQYYKQTVYQDGKVLYSGDYNKQQWDKFLEGINDLKYFCIGRSSMHKNGYWHYSKMKAYCFRLYSRALNGEEVQKNYEKAVEYHSLLEKQ